MDFMMESRERTRCSRDVCRDVDLDLEGWLAIAETCSIKLFFY